MDHLHKGPLDHDPVAYLFKVAPMAKFKCAPFHNNLNIRCRRKFYERKTIRKINVLKRKIFVFIFAINFSATKIKIVHKDHNILLYSFIFIMKNIKTFK